MNLDELRKKAKEWRKINDKNQSWMVEHSGLKSISLYSEFERGNKRIPYDNARRIEELIAPVLPADREPILSAPASPPAPSELPPLNRDSTCPACHQQVPGFSQGCVVCCYCAEPLGPECPKCGTVNLPGSKYCRDCAHPLTETAKAQIAQDKADLARLTETAKQKRLRKADEAEQKRKPKQGEPEL